MYLSMHDVIIKMWCIKQEFEEGNTVSGSKLVAFLTEVARISNIKNKKIKLLDGNPNSLGKESLAGYAKAVGALQTVQAAVLGNTNQQLVVSLLKALTQWLWSRKFY